MRVFLGNEKGKGKADDILKLHGFFNESGPMWLGNLWDRELCNKVHCTAVKNKIFRYNKELANFLKIIKDESEINAVGFYDLNEICKSNKIKNLQKKNGIIDKIRKSGHMASETHFKGEGIRSNVPINGLIKILKNK